MDLYTVEEFQENWDELITRIENGEHIAITNGKHRAIMVPADDPIISIHTELNNDAS